MQVLKIPVANQLHKTLGHSFFTDVTIRHYPSNLYKILIGPIQMILLPLGPKLVCRELVTLKLPAHAVLRKGGLNLGKVSVCLTIGICQNGCCGLHSCQTCSGRIQRREGSFTCWIFCSRSSSAFLVCSFKSSNSFLSSSLPSDWILSMTNIFSSRRCIVESVLSVVSRMMVCVCSCLPSRSWKITRTNCFQGSILWEKVESKFLWSWAEFTFLAKKQGGI